MLKRDFLKRLFLGGTIAKRLIAFLLLGIILPLTFLTYLTYKSIYDKMADQYTENILGSISYISDAFNSYYNSLNKFPFVVYDEKDKDLVNLLNQQISDDYEVNYRLYTKIKSVFYSRSDIVNLRFYTKLNNSLMTFNDEKTNTSSDFLEVTEYDLEKKIPYYDRLSSRNMKYLSGVYRNEVPETEGKPSQWIYTLNQMIMDLSNTKILSVLSVDLNTTVLDKQLKDLTLKNGEIIIVLNERAELLYLKGNASYEDGCGDEMLKSLRVDKEKGSKYIDKNGERYLAVYCRMKNNPYYLYRIIPVKNIYEGISGSITKNVVLSIIFIIAFIILIIVISSRSSIPIRKIIEKMKLMEKGKFDVRIDYTTYDSQFGLLIDRFNQMSDEINTLFNERFKLQLAQKNAELKALQTQINPHFLYNTLQTVQYMALKRNAFEIDSIVNALGEILRYCIKNKHDIVTLEQEMEYVDKYLLIQSFKHDNLKVFFNLDSDIKSIMVPKMIIQPFIENCFIHGYQKDMESFCIWINCFKRGNEAVIEISDNGKGIDEEPKMEMEELFGSENAVNSLSGEEIGIKNVYTRLKIIYGDRFRLEINSIPFEKTSFVMTIALEEEQQ